MISGSFFYLPPYGQTLGEREMSRLSFKTFNFPFHFALLSALSRSSSYTTPIFYFFFLVPLSSRFETSNAYN